jgi:hypothetical protein
VTVVTFDWAEAPVLIRIDRCFTAGPPGTRAHEKTTEPEVHEP